MKQLMLATIIAVMSMVSSYPAFADGWVPCATENQFCTVPGTKIVRYGEGKRWAQKMVTRRIYCGNDAFGDPAPGAVKACYFQDIVSPGPAERDHGYVPHGERDVRPHWGKCANEGQYCRFDGQRSIRYGAGDRWSHKIARNGIRCGNDVFGDPAPGTAKACYVEDVVSPGPAERDHGYAPHRERDVRPHWEKCADEGQYCKFDGKRNIRYGTGDRWNHKTARYGIRCRNSEFGDPAPGAAKACYIEVE